MIGKRQQIAAQYRAVAHLARELSLIHSEAASIIPTAPDGVVDIMGERSARLMEMLGDALNGMDAVQPGDKWLNPIFDEAHRLFPARAEDAQDGAR